VSSKINFLQALQRSGLLSDSQIRDAVGAVGKKEPHLSRHLVKKGLLTRFQAGRLRTGVSGFLFGKYIVLDFVGKGRNSVVYKARHCYLPNRVVALKTIMLSDQHGTDKSDDLHRRLNALAQLEHRNIVRVYDVLVKERSIFLVLEYVDGCNLAEMVAQFGPLPVEDAVAYALQTARALSYAHGSNTILRTITPANLMLARDGTVKFTGHGLTENPPRQLGSVDRGHGSEGFMAPEQIEAPGSVDGQSDLYSLGASLYFLLTGNCPLKRNGAMQQAEALLKSRPDVPLALTKVVQNLLAPRAKQRPKNADEVISIFTPFARENGRDVDPRQWDGRRKAALVIDVLKEKVDAVQACKEYSLASEELEAWKRRFMEAGARALDTRSSAQSMQQEVIEALHAKIGAQAVELEQLRAHTESIL
jgi:serine/threonine-protein kinase